VTLDIGGADRWFYLYGAVFWGGLDGARQHTVSTPRGLSATIGPSLLPLATLSTEIFTGMIRELTRGQRLQSGYA
jgi:hypothetical protein